MTNLIFLDPSKEATIKSTMHIHYTVVKYSGLYVDIKSAILADLQIVEY